MYDPKKTLIGSKHHLVNKAQFVISVKGGFSLEISTGENLLKNIWVTSQRQAERDRFCSLISSSRMLKYPHFVTLPSRLTKTATDAIIQSWMSKIIQLASLAP